MGNICCRVFKEQLDLINQLPEQERAIVLYHTINSCFNQNENQIDFQLDFSSLGKAVYNILRKNIICKEFSNNYGGPRKGAGRPVSKGNNQIENQNDNQIDNQIENQNENAYISVSESVSVNNLDVDSSSLRNTRASKFTPPTLQEVFEYAKQQNEMAGCGGFACSKATAEEFWGNYESNGWVIGNESQTPVRDWKAKLRQWCARERKRSL